ncbi:MAG: hypothetical protein HYR85_16845 [Planctomycetes bacterium]|nr:hypothetical protein [Planctomycetota bacterium]MBI3847191.1 hypothetical protein [Planctomycetota bacterium]
MTHSRLCRIARLLVLLTGATIIGGLCATLCVIGSYPLLLPTPAEVAPASDEPVLQAPSNPEPLAASSLLVVANPTASATADRALGSGQTPKPSTSH